MAYSGSRILTFLACRRVSPSSVVRSSSLKVDKNCPSTPLLRNAFSRWPSSRLSYDRRLHHLRAIARTQQGVKGLPKPNGFAQLDLNKNIVNHSRWRARAFKIIANRNRLCTSAPKPLQLAALCAPGPPSTLRITTLPSHNTRNYSKLHTSCTPAAHQLLANFAPTAGIAFNNFEEFESQR